MEICELSKSMIRSGNLHIELRGRKYRETKSIPVDFIYVGFCAAVFGVRHE